MEVLDVIQTLGQVAADESPASILPRDRESLEKFYHRLRAFVAAAPRVRDGHVDPRACVDGDIIAMGSGSVIEAGAIVHPSCRLILAARSTVRARPVLPAQLLVGSPYLLRVHSP